MAFLKPRVFVSAALFIAWLGFLVYLVIETPKTHVARPQFMIAQAVIVAAVRDDGGVPDPDVDVKEVLSGAGLTKGQKLRIADLIALAKENGYSGPGTYVVPVLRHGSRWQIAPIPAPYRKATHGTLEIVEVGDNPERVLDRLVEYAKQKPREVGDQLDPFMPALAFRVFGPAFFDPEPALFGPEFDWREKIMMPRGVRLRIPIADAVSPKDGQSLAKDLEASGASVRLIGQEELRIYADTPAVRAEAAEISAGLKKLEGR